MSGNETIPTLNLIVFVLVSTGVLGACAEVIRWYFTGRGRAKVSDAEVVQGMALNLIKPLHEEVAEVRRNLHTLDAELQSVLGWAIIARALLDSHHIEYPSPPDALQRTR